MCRDVPNILPVSSTYVFLHDFYSISLHCIFCLLVFCLWGEPEAVTVLYGVLLLCFFMILCMGSFIPRIYGRVTMFFCLCFSSVFCFLFFVFDLPFFFVHCPFWILAVRNCMLCCSSLCLSSVMMMLARLYSVLTTDSLCAVGCSDVQRRFWSVCVGFLYIVILMLPSSLW